MDTEKTRTIVHRVFESTFGDVVRVVNIKPTVIRSIDQAITAFIIVASPIDCQCTPCCTKEAIALLYKGACAFITEKHYDKLDEMAKEVIREGNIHG